MTDHDLATLVSAHVRQDEPPFRMSPERAIALGRRRMVRRRARRGLTGILVAAAVVPGAFVLVDRGSPSDGPHHGVDAATTARLRHYEAAAMPGFLDRRAREVLERSIPNLGAGRFTAEDGQLQRLPAKYYDKASRMSVSYGSGTDDQVTVTLLHARSEAEGNARTNCAHDLADGTYVSCRVSHANGDTVTTRVTAVRPLGAPAAGMGVVTTEELRTRRTSRTDPSQAPIDPSRIFFARSVESVHSDTFLTSAEELVRAPSLAAAERAWRVPVADLTELVTDPELVIPPPPTQANGCAWTLPGTNVSCH